MEQHRVQPQAQSVQPAKQLSDEELHLNKLRLLLGAGQRMDAIELAVKFNMWPHALFLASYSNGNGMNSTTMSGSQTFSNINANAQAESKLLGKVKTRFINSLQQNDPIQTCYQLLVGRIPTVANVSLRTIDIKLVSTLNWLIFYFKEFVQVRLERLASSFGHDCFQC